jgi:hypothetical protein
VPLAQRAHGRDPGLRQRRGGPGVPLDDGVSRVDDRERLAARTERWTFGSSRVTEAYPAFAERFWAAFLTFVLYSGAHYVFVLTMGDVGRVGLVGHLWRLALLFGCGGVLSLAGARLSGVNAPQPAAAV